MEAKSEKAVPSLRWWPLGLILLLVASCATWGFFVLPEDRQKGYVLIIGGAFLGLIAGWIWLLFFARGSARLRVGALGIGLLLPATFFTLFRYEGVTGDLLPIFSWRFAARSTTAAPEPRSNEAEGLADFTQFFGPDRRGVLSGPVLARDWQSEPPVEIWRVPVGEGWSGFAVAGRFAITQEQDGDDELVTCRDALSGKMRWTHRYKARYVSGVAGNGPRATPSVDASRVYTLGASGILCCLKLESGKELWTKDLQSEHEAPALSWGFAGSPLITERLCIVSAGGDKGRSLIAYDKESGKLVWSAGSDKAHWSSPLVAELLGIRQVLIFNENSLAAHAIDDGRILWERAWNPRHAHATLPRVFGEDRVLISSGYGEGAEMIRVQRDAAGAWSCQRVWRSRHLKAKFANFVDFRGSIYAIDDGILACIDPETGRRRWKKGRYGHGQVLLVGELLLVTAERGAIVLIEPHANELRELARFDVFDHKLWNPPALAGRYLLLRTAREAACIRLPIASR